MNSHLVKREPACANPACCYNRILVFAPEPCFEVIDPNQIGASNPKFARRESVVAYKTKTINRVRVIRDGIEYLYCEDCAKRIIKQDNNNEC